MFRYWNVGSSLIFKFFQNLEYAKVTKNISSLCDILRKKKKKEIDKIDK